jgi:dienelactone hydrolase
MKKRVIGAASPEQCFQMTNQVLEHYKIDTKITPTAFIGFCWGGYMGRLIIQNLPSVQFKAFAVCHPPTWDDEIGSEITVPLIAIPAKDDFDMTKFFKNLKPEIKEKSEHHRFNDVVHGFASARANLQDETNLREYNRAIGLISEFFNKRIF